MRIVINMTLTRGLLHIDLKKQSAPKDGIRLDNCAEVLMQTIEKWVSTSGAKSSLKQAAIHALPTSEGRASTPALTTNTKGDSK